MCPALSLLHSAGLPQKKLLWNNEIMSLAGVSFFFLLIQTAVLKLLMLPWNVGTFHGMNSMNVGSCSLVGPGGTTSYSSFKLSS